MPENVAGKEAQPKADPPLAGAYKCEPTQPVPETHILKLPSMNYRVTERSAAYAVKAKDLLAGY